MTTGHYWTRLGIDGILMHEYTVITINTVMQHSLWLQMQINAWNDRSSSFYIPGRRSWHILGFPGPTLFDCHQVLAFHSPRCFLVMIFQASALGQFLTDMVTVHFHSSVLFMRSRCCRWWEFTPRPRCFSALLAS
jgi:hypothetical protein